jgi:D-apionolactonase
MTIDAASARASRAVRLCGTEAIDPPSRRLVAGLLAAELQNGQLRYVTFAGVEVLRGIAFLVRDENWGTYAPEIEGLKIEESAEGFIVEYRAKCADARQQLIYQARISGSPDGSLSFEAVAIAATDILTNRTGFVVLHPARLAGQTVRVAHVDGREVDARFPRRISPSQPIFNIRALAHEVFPGLWATCRMEGDVFEMEDQRNWGDASYKTYIRPLAAPWPYTLGKGSRHEQVVRLSFDAPARGGGGHANNRDITVALGGDLGTSMPEIGIALPAREASGALARIDHLRKLAPRFIVCAIDARNGSGLAELSLYRQVAEGIPAAVVMEIIIPDEMDAAAALAPIASSVVRAGLKLDAVVISSAADLKSWQPGAKRPEAPTVEQICEAARAAFPGVRLGGGMLSTFTELNRKPPKASPVDYVTHTTCATVHAADDRSVMETLETLPAIIASTRAMIGEKPYRIGPSAIAARDNPYGKGVADNPANGRVCLADRDPRQRGLFNAAWTLGYVAACAYGGLEAVAIGAATGPFGFIHRRGDPTVPYFDAIDGPVVYPAFHVLAGLAHGSGRTLIETRLSQVGRAAALAWRENGRSVQWLANLTAEPLSLRIGGLAGANRRLCVIDAAAFEQATMTPDALDVLARPFAGESLTLDAYATALID